MTTAATLTPPQDTAAPAAAPAPTTAPQLSPDRAELATETARMPGGSLDPDSWVVPRGSELETFLREEPDQGRIDRYALEWLRTATESQAKGTGGGIHEDFKEGLRVYREFRRSRGEQPFQYIEADRTRSDERAARKQVPFFQKLLADPQRMAEAFPEEERAAFDERFVNSIDPLAERQQTAGILFVSAMTGRDVEQVATLWPSMRESYGRDVLKIAAPGKITDASFYDAARAAIEREVNDEETARTVAQQAQRAAIQGKPLSDAIQQGKAATGATWRQFEPAARAAYAGILAEFSDPEIRAGRALFEAVADMEGQQVEEIAQGDGERAAWVIALESYGKADQRTRDNIMNLIALQADAEGEDVQAYFARLGKAFGSGLDMLSTGIGTLSARAQVADFRRMAEASTDPQRKAALESRIPYLEGKATFAQDIATAGVKVRRYLDDKREGFWDSLGDISIMAAESVPLMGAAALPFGAGIPAVVAAYGERNLATLRRSAPDASAASLYATAYTSGAVEAGIDRLQWFTLGARMPKLNARLMEFGKPGAVAVATARTLAVGAAETGQEIAQDLTLPAVQQIAAALSEDIPGPDWGKVLADEADALGDIAAVSLLFAVIGATGSTITDYAQAPKIAAALQDRDALALAGYSPETVEEVATLAEKNPAAAAETLKAATIETPKEERQANAQAAREALDATPATTRRNVTTAGKVTSYGYASDETPDANSAAGIGAWVSEEEQARIRAGEDTPNKLRPNDLAVSPDIEAELRRAGIVPGDSITIRLDDGTEVETRWMDRTADTLTERFDLYSPDGVNPLDGRAVVAWSHEVPSEREFPTAEDAGLPTLEKLDDGRVMVNFPDAPAVLADSPESALDAVREWEQAQEVDTTRAVREYIEFLTDYHASNPEAVFVGRETGREVTLETWAGDSKERIAQANKRLDILMRQAGPAMGIERPLLSDVPILGTSRNVRAGAITRMVAELNKGANPLTVIEEAAEGVAKWLMSDGKVSESKMLGWIRDTEQQTGTKILADDIANMTPEQRAQEIAEGFSFVAKNNAAGRIQESALPSAVKAFFRAFKELIAQTLRIAADFAKLRAEGKVDPAFEYWLDVAAGIEPEFQMDNLTRQMEAEQLAEAMDGFTEVSDALAGRIPHPDTLEAQGDPLAGEVRRLYEGILENPDNGASKSARRRKANEWFLPKGQTANLDEIRRSVNELGFGFDTPADMIEAADMSLNYGRKVFGTVDQGADLDAWGEPTFSIALRTDPLLAAIDAQAKNPAKKAEVWEKMRARVSTVKRRFEDRRLRGDFDNETGSAVDRARFEQIRDIATLEAIGKALPPDIRGKIVGSFRKVADLKTTKARARYITELLPRIERALESSLQRQYRTAIRRQIAQAAVQVSESKTRGGKIGALGHAVFEEARATIRLTDDPPHRIGGKTAAEKAEEIAARLRDTLESSPDLTDEQLAELDGRIAAVELFGDYGNADSRRLAEALGFLQGTYAEGRQEWLAVLSERRAVRVARVAEIEKAFGREAPPTDAERTAAKRRAESLLSRIDEAVMQAGLSGSQKIRRLSETTNDPAITALAEEIELAFLEAENQEADQNDADNRALAAAMRRIFGTSTEYGTAKKLRELTTATGPAPVEKIEGRKVETVKVPVRFVENILAGELAAVEAGGERFAEEVKAFDDYDLAQLEIAWEQFNELPEAQQARRKVIEFDRITAAGDRTTIGPVNQLEGLQLYLTMRQPDQAAKLDRLGYDAETLAQLEEWLRPEVKALGAWMVNHIGEGAFTLDAIHRAEKGVGLRLVENYFPVRNDVAGADNAGLSLDGSAVQHTGRSIGAIKERVPNNAPPAYVNALAVFLANRAQVNFWTSHVATLREWGGLIRDERFASAVKIRMGEAYYRSLETMLRRIEAGGALNAAKLMDWERLVKRLTSSFAIGTLGGRVSTLAVNMSAALNFGLEIPAADFAKGLREVVDRPEAFKDAWNSPAIRRRLEQGASFEAQLAKAGGPSAAPTISQLNAWAQKGVMPINYVDTAANVFGAAVVWQHTRNQSTRAGMTEEQARAAADRAVSRLMLRAAQPTTRLGKSEIELKMLENPLAALFLLFTSEPRKNLAIAYMAGRELATGRGTYGKAMAAQQLFVSLVILQTTEFFIRSVYGAIAKAEDDEPEDTLDRIKARVFDAKAWGYALTTNHLRAVPLGGEVWAQGWAGLFDQRAFPASQNPLNRAAREVFTFEKPETTAEAIDGAIDILQGVGPVVPGGAIFAQGGNAAEFITGLATSNGLDFSDEDRAERIRGRFNRYRSELDEIHGKTTDATGKARKDVQAAKWNAMADRLRSDLAAASPEIRAMVLESVNAPAEVKDRVRGALANPNRRETP